MEADSPVSTTGNTQSIYGTSVTSSPHLQPRPGVSFPEFRPGVTVEGYVLRPYLSADVILANLFDFREGDILSVPVDTVYMHPNKDSTFRSHSVDTPESSVYISRRIMVVIKLYNNSMLCLPMFSFGLTGIAAVPHQYRQDYIGVRQEEESSDTEHSGGIRRIQFECFGPKTMHPSSLVHLLGALHVHYSREIVDVGRVPKESFEELMTELNIRQSCDG